MTELFENMKISYNGRYLTSNGRIYDVITDKSVMIESIHPLFWLEFMRENSVAAYKTKKLSEIDLQTMLRKSVYTISETFEKTENKVKTLMEYEMKFGSTLLMESSYSFEKSLNQGWLFLIENAVRNFPGYEHLIQEGLWGDFTSGVSNLAGKAWSGIKSAGGAVVDTVGQGLDYVGGKVKQAGDWLADNTLVGSWVAQGYKWLKEKGLKWLMEGLRSAVYSPVGIAVELFLTVTGVGAPVVMVVYGLLLLWDISLLLSGDANFSWWEIFFDVLGIVTSGVGAAPARAAVKATGIIEKTAGKTLQETVEIGAKKGGVVGSFLKTLGNALGKGASYVLGWVKRGTEWLAKNFGWKGLDKYVGNAKTYVDDLVKSLNKVDNVLPSAAQASKTLEKSGQAVATQAAKKPGIVSRTWNAAGRALDKPIEKLLPGTAKTFEKNIFGRTIKNPGKISTGIRTGVVGGGLGYGLHSYAENKAKAAEKEAEERTQQDVQDLTKGDADYSEFLP